MFSLRKINPMARAVGTMGAIAAIVGGITYAATINSGTVKLTNNTISTPSLGLAISTPKNNGGCPNSSATSWTSSMQGMTITNLTSASQTYNFCLENTADTGSGPQTVTMTSPATITTSGIPASQISLTVGCGTATPAGGTLDTFGPSDNFVVDGAFSQGAIESCTATVTLNSSYSGSGGSVNPFELDFTGTQS